MEWSYVMIPVGGSSGDWLLQRGPRPGANPFECVVAVSF